MWENETVVLVTSLKKRILGGKERVRFERIESDTAIPGFIKRLFRDRVELYFIKESPLILQNTPHFSLEPSEINKVKGFSNDILMGAASFYEKEIEIILQEALVLRLEYLIKPIHTLKQRLFGEGATCSINSIEDLIEPFRKTLSYGDALIQTCQQMGMTELGENEFGDLAEKIIKDQSGHDPVAWISKDFSVLTNYLSESKGEEVARLDGSIIRDFLVDRKQRGFERAVNVEMKLGRSDFNVADLQVTLKRYQQLRSEFGEVLTIETPLREPDQDPVEIDFEISSPASEEALDTVVESPEKVVEETLLDLGDDWDSDDEASDEGVDLELEKQESVSIDSILEPEEQAVEISASTPQSMRIIRREQTEELTVKEVDKVKSIQPGKGSSRSLDLRSLIDSRTEKSFVKKLFGGDHDAYDLHLEKLRDAESWRVAKILIDNELFKRDVDPFSREAIKLVDLVYGRYYPEENAGGQ